MTKPAALLPIIFSLLLLKPLPAFAGVWLQTGFSVIDAREDSGGTSATTSGLQYFSSATGGYLFPQGFILGAQALAARSDSTGNNDWGIGPKGGLWLKGFELTAAYLPIVRETLSGGSTRKGA